MVASKSNGQQPGLTRFLSPEETTALPVKQLLMPSYSGCLNSAMCSRTGDAKGAQIAALLCDQNGQCVHDAACVPGVAFQAPELLMMLPVVATGDAQRAQDAALLCDHDEQGGQAAARMPGQPCEGGGGCQIPHGGHPAPAVPLHSRQAQGAQHSAFSAVPTAPAWLIHQ